MKNKLLLLVSLFATLTIILAACGESEPLATNVRKTNIRFWNMMPDANAKALDFIVDRTELTVSNVRFKQETTDYSQVFSRAVNIQVFPVLNGSRTARPTIDTIADFSNRQDQFFTMMVVDSARKNAPLLIRDNYNLRPDTLTGRFQLRVLHLSPNAPGVNIGLVRETDTTYIIPDTLTFLRNLGTAEITSQARFRTFSLSATNPTLADTTLRLVIREVAGGTIIPVGDVRVQEKSVYTVIARGIVGASGAQEFETRIIKDR